MCSSSHSAYGMSIAPRSSTIHQRGLARGTGAPTHSHTACIVRTILSSKPPVGRLSMMTRRLWPTHACESRLSSAIASSGASMRAWLFSSV